MNPIPKRLSAILFLLLSGSASNSAARVWHVPTEAPTIQAGIDSALAGDIVEISCGIYYEHNIQMKAGITLKSETGEASCVVLDAQRQGIGIICHSLFASATIRGLTITGGLEPDGYIHGGGLSCNINPRLITVSHCLFRGNSGLYGGGAWCMASNVSFDFCSFRNNTAWAGGGAYINVNPATFTNCSFRNNSVEYDGGGIKFGSTVNTNYMYNCTISGNEAGSQAGGLYVGQANLDAYNTDILNNSAPQGMDGYIEENAEVHFYCCDVVIRNFYHWWFIYVHNDGCPVPVDGATWGSVKAMYR